MQCGARLPIHTYTTGPCWCFGHTSVYLCASSLQNLAVLQDIFHHSYLCGTILVTLHSMVWDWRVLRAGPMLFY